MSGIDVVLVSFTPGLLWLWFFARIDRLRPAPPRLIVLSFLLGMLSTLPAGAVEFLAIDRDRIGPDAALASVAAAMLAVVGPVEEVSKFLAVRLGAYRSRYFEEPMDGLVHGAAASLGFASLENLLYVLSFGPEVMLVRAPLSTLAHLVFGSLWGYGLGLHQQGERRRRGPLLLLLAGAALLHGAFNVALFSPLAWLAAPLITLTGALWTYRRFEWGQRISPFRYRRNVPLAPCARCGRAIRTGSAYCTRCGARQHGGPGAVLICGNCRRRNRPDALYCTGCGDRLLG